MSINNRGRVVYICAPYSGDVNLNTARAITLARKAYEEGYTVITPHVMFPFCDDSTDRAEVLEMCKHLVRRSSEIWVLGDIITDGMAEEIITACCSYNTLRCFDPCMNELGPCLRLGPEDRTWVMKRKISDAVSKARR